jgi:ribosomal protein S12 methylthiotransferase
MLGDPVPEETKEERRAEIMDLQARISQEKNDVLVETSVKVLFDRTEGDYAVGRTERDAPEVDNEVLVPLKEFNGNALIGNFYSVRITEANEFDLTGTLDTKSP